MYFKSLGATILFFTISFNSSSQWNIVSTGTTDHLNSIEYNSSGVSWVGGTGSTLKSQNFGVNWLYQDFKDSIAGNASLNGRLHGIHGFSYSRAALTGFIVLGNDALMYKTYLGNGSWTRTYYDNLYVTPPRTLNDIKFSSNSIGISVGYGGRILKSTNGGDSWTLMSSPVSSTLENVEYLGANTWIACGSGVTLRSTNDGGFWAPAFFTGNWIDVSFYGNTGYMIDDSGNMLKSTDGGLNWYPKNPSLGTTTAVHAIDTNIIFLATTSDLYVSYTGGQYWEQFELSSYQRINSIDFFDAQNGICVGENGYLIRTVNAGGNSFPIAKFSNFVTTICTDSLLTFTNSSNPAYTFQWLADGVPYSTSYNSNYTFSTPGTHTISLIANNGVNTDTTVQTITVVDPPIVPVFSVSVTATSICKNQTVTSSVPSSVVGVSYRLYNNGVAVGSAQSGNGATLNFSSGALSTSCVLSIRGTKTNSCTTTTVEVSNNITVVQPATNSYSEIVSDSLCYNTGTYVNVYNTDPNFSYTWSSSPILSGSNNPIVGNNDTIVIPLPNMMSNYTISIKAQSISPACTYTLPGSALIRVFNPSLSFTPLSYSVLVNEQLNLTNSSNYTTYYWDFGVDGNPVSSTQTSPSVNYINSGTKTISLTGVLYDSVCVKSVSKNIEVFDPITNTSNGTCSQGSSNGNIHVLDYYLDGFNSSYSTGIISTSSYSNLFIRKHDSTGQEIFSYNQPYSSNAGTTSGLGITADEMGNMYVSGTMSGTSITILGNYSEEKNFILKFDRFGQLIWMISSPSASWVDLEYKNGYLYTAGYGASTSVLIKQPNGITFSATNPGGTIGGNGFILKLDTDGNVIDFKNFGTRQAIASPAAYTNITFYSTGTTTFKTMPKLGFAQNGDLVVAGVMDRAASNDNYFFGGSLMQNHFAIDTALNDAQIYLFNYDGSSITNPRNVISGTPVGIERVLLDEEDNVYITGNIKNHLISTQGYDRLEHGSYPGPSVDGFSYLIKSDVDGNLIWQTNTKYAFFNDIALADDKLFLLSSYSRMGGFYDSNDDYYGILSDGVSDFAILEFDTSGILQRLEKGGGATADVAYRMATDDCGNIHTIEMWNNSILNYPDPIYCNCPQTGNIKVSTYRNNICNDTCFLNYNSLSKDLAIEEIIISDTTINGPSNRTLSFTLKNWAAEIVTGAVINWQINHDLPQSMSYSGSLAYAQIDSNIFMTTYNFNSPYNRIKVWISSVNGSPDDEHRNDTLIYEQYVCTSPMSGTYTIDPYTGDFISITSSLKALKSCGIDNPTEIVLSPGIYHDQISITPIPGANVNDTIVWRSLNNDPTEVIFQYQPMMVGHYALIRAFNDASYFSFSGITLKYNQSNPNNFIFQMGNNCSYIHLDNCHVIGLTGNSGQELLYQGNVTHNHNIYITNNIFYYGDKALALDGSSSARDSLIFVRGNRFLSQRTTAIYLRWINKYYIEDNYIYGNSLSSSSWQGIYVNSCTKELYINRNNIVALASAGLNTNQIYINGLGGNALKQSTMYNNMLYVEISGQPCVALGTVSYIKIMHNSMRNGIVLGSTISNGFTFQNNLMHVYGEAIEMPSLNAGYVIDHNQYYYDTIYPLRFRASSTYYNFQNWTTLSGYDQNSVYIQPQYSATADLHILPGTGIAGLPQSIITTDIDGEIRNASAPIIGADEPNNDLTISLLQITNSGCQNASTGSISINIFGGNTPFTFLWSNGETTQNISGLTSGNYWVIVTDANSDMDTMYFVLSTTTSTVSQTVLTIDKTCFNSNNGSATVNATGGTPMYSYNWSTGETGTVIDSLDAGSYWVIATDANNCLDTTYFVISDVSDSILVDNLNLIHPTCDQSANGLIQIDIEGGILPYTYQWNNGSDSTVIDSLQEGNYTVIVTDSMGCNASFNFSLIETSGLISANITGNIFVNEGDTLDYTVSTDPDYNYLWQVTGGNILTGQSTGSITVIWDTTATGQILVAVTDSLGCTAYDTLIVQINNVLYSVELNSTKIKLAPNPASEFFYVINIPEQVSKISIINSIGQIVREYSSVEKDLLVELTLLNDGMYQVVFFGEENVILHGIPIIIVK